MVPGTASSIRLKSLRFVLEGFKMQSILPPFFPLLSLSLFQTSFFPFLLFSFSLSFFIFLSVQLRFSINHHFIYFWSDDIPPQQSRRGHSNILLPGLQQPCTCEPLGGCARSDTVAVLRGPSHRPEIWSAQKASSCGSSQIPVGS